MRKVSLCGCLQTLACTGGSVCIMVSTQCEEPPCEAQPMCLGKYTLGWGMGVNIGIWHHQVDESDTYYTYFAAH